MQFGVLHWGMEAFIIKKVGLFLIGRGVWVELHKTLNRFGLCWLFRPRHPWRGGEEKE